MLLHDPLYSIFDRERLGLRLGERGGERLGASGIGAYDIIDESSSV